MTFHFVIGLRNQGLNGVFGLLVAAAIAISVAISGGVVDIVAKGFRGPGTISRKVIWRFSRC